MYSTALADWAICNMNNSMEYLLYVFPAKRFQVLLSNTNNFIQFLIISLLTVDCFLEMTIVFFEEDKEVGNLR